MNWKLIIQLSMFGLAMGIATVFVIPSSIEPLFWLVIFGICGYIIAIGIVPGIFAVAARLVMARVGQIAPQRVIKRRS